MLKEGMGSSERVCFEKGRTCGMCSVETKRSGVGWAVEWVTGGGGGGSDHSFGRERVAAHIDQFQFPFMCHEYKILQLKEF